MNISTFEVRLVMVNMDEKRHSNSTKCSKNRIGGIKWMNMLDLDEKKRYNKKGSGLLPEQVRDRSGYILFDLSLGGYLW